MLQVKEGGEGFSFDDGIFVETIICCYDSLISL